MKNSSKKSSAKSGSLFEILSSRKKSSSKKKAEWDKKYYNGMTVLFKPIDNGHISKSNKP